MSNLRLTAYSSFFNYIFTTVSQRFSNCVWRAFYFRDHYAFGMKIAKSESDSKRRSFCGPLTIIKFTIWPIIKKAGHSWLKT